MVAGVLLGLPTLAQRAMSVPLLPPDRQPFQLMLVDADLVFRTGLRLWLEQFVDLAIVAEADNGATALQLIAERTAQGLSSPRTDRLGAIDLVILDLAIRTEDPLQPEALRFCQQFKARYPTLPVLAIGHYSEPVMVAAVRQAGANGYCLKATPLHEWLEGIRQVAAGQSWWSVTEPPRLPDRPLPIDRPPPSTGAPIASQAITPLMALRRSLRRSGLQQIDAALMELVLELEQANWSPLDRAILLGRRRELQAARRLVNWLWASPETSKTGVRPTGGPGIEARPAVTEPQDWFDSYTDPSPLTLSSQQSPPRIPSPSRATSASDLASPSALEQIPGDRLMSDRDITSLLLNAVAAKLQTTLENQTEVTLETDILREDKKRELFYLILRKLEDLFSELRYSQVTAEQLPAKRDLMVLDLWRATTVDFFGKYYTVQLQGQPVEVVETLLQNATQVQVSILNAIPGVIDLFLHILFQQPLTVDGSFYPVGNPESLARAEQLLENLVIQLANAVIQPLLNRFANLETIKQSFYDRRLMSSREIERFRNNLSWRYRMSRYLWEPTAIFESRYLLYGFAGRGIKTSSIYAPRRQELDDLSGLPLMVTLALETRDAIAPRLRSVVSFVGNSLVYVLTDVIGRGIGLIGRGVLKGIGNAWQDSRWNRR